MTRIPSREVRWNEVSMKKRGALGKRLFLFVVMTLFSGLVACRGGPFESPTANQSGDLAGLQQQVAAQGTRIALLETRVALAPAAAAGAAIATPTARPTPTIIPAVEGLVTEGTTKGAADAPVTIIEYTDYL